MKFFAIAALCLLTGCLGPFRHKVTPPAPISISGVPAPSDAKASKIIDDAASKVSASVRAAARANDANPDGAAKTATAGELSVAQSILPEPSAADAAAAFERVNNALRGDLTKAQAQWQQASGEAATLRANLASSQAAAERERADAAAKLNAREAEWSATFQKLQADADARVVAAKAQAEAEQRRLLNWIFHGVGAACVVLGILSLTLLSSIPQLGSKIGWGLICAGVSSISFGIAVDWVLSHPWIPVVVIGALLLVCAVLFVANHWHHTNQPAKAP